jgi:epsin
LEESNAQSLFDDTPVQPTQAQPTGFNQGYQQQPAVDWFGNPIDTQQPLTTGYLNNQYAQPTGFQPQQTGFPGGYQVQPTGIDPYKQFGQPENNGFQSQPTGFNNNNPYGNTGGFGQPQQQQPQQQDNFLQPGSHNPWATNNQHAPDTLKPLPTGSNNPFASSINRPGAQPARTGPPTLNTLAEEQAATAFSNFPSGPNPITNFKAPSPAQPTATQQMPRHEENPQHARLNALLASGEGQDTFGNVGDLRLPSHHTAATYINSAGQGAQSTPTGNNPFFNQQFTGMPQQTGFVQQNNPFGGQQRQQQQGGSLIDL